MRPGQQNKRGRGRSGGGGGGGGGNFNRKGANPLTRTYDSSGPDVKIRGTAQHIAEKYSTLARDAQSAGDRVMAENYLQHAEHYNRIIAAAQAQMQDRAQRDERGDYSDRDGSDRDNDDIDSDDQPVTTVRAPAVEIAGTGPQPVIDEAPAEVPGQAAAQEVEGAEKQARRRNAPRPRRQPRRNAAADDAGDDNQGGSDERAKASDETGAAPVLAAAASE